MNFIVITPKGTKPATKWGVFGDIVAGSVKNACVVNAGDSGGRKYRFFLRISEDTRIPITLRSWFVYPWNVKYEQVAPLLKPGEENCVICAPSVRPFQGIQPPLIWKLRRRNPDCRLVFLYTDSIERIAWGNRCSIEALKRFTDRFDLVLTYDRHDAEKYGYRFADIPLWNTANEPCGEAKYDLFFCGHPKQREAIINGILARLREHGGAVPRFILAGSPEAPLSEEVVMTKWRPYYELVDDLKASRCILELMADRNTGTTLRYKEAVVYNKKLLTNNPDIAQLPYYDSRWMRYFEKPSDIDVDWILRDEPVDYGYKGDFSAERFLREVQAALDAQANGSSK